MLSHRTSQHRKPYRRPYRRSGFSARTQYRKRTYKIPKSDNSTANRQQLTWALSNKIPPFPQTCPHSQIVTLRYVDKLQKDVSAGGYSTQTYSANGINDPDVTNTGHQPIGFDEYMKFYNNYRVLGSKITFRQIFTSSTTNATPALVHIDGNQSNVATAFDSPQTFLENFGGIATFMSGNYDSAHFIPNTISRTFSAKKAFGPTWRSTSAFWGSDGYNPGTQYYYHIYFWSVDGNDPTGVNYLVQVDYIVEFFNKKPISIEE